MADLESLLYEQTTTIASMSRLLTNLKKVGKNNFTPALLQNRLSNLNNIRLECKALDRQIYSTASADERKTLQYFKEEEYLNAESIYYEVSDYISTALSVCAPAMNANSTVVGNCTFQDGTRGSYTPLPRIDIPKFSGSYTEWVSFRDMFQSLVINNDVIQNVQKLHYLKMAVSGEASSLLKTITISETNFQLAWSKLKDRYENSRHIIDSHLTKLFDVSAVATENVKDLKQLRDQTYDAVSSLENLQRPVDQCSDLITFMTVRKLDPTSRREWEMRIGDKTTYPKYDEIHAFLEYRIRALESILSPSSKKPNKPKGEGNSTKAHLFTASKLCECAETHPLYKCEQFRAKSVEQRQRIVRELKLCNNCLGSGHQTKQCHSKVVCYHCKQKHNTLLHRTNAQKNEKNDKVETLSFIPSGGSNSSVQPAASSQSLSPINLEPQASSTQHVVSNLHACETEIAPASVMLATAWVLVSSSKGQTIKVRAPLDQGSQSSFVTESIVQLIRAPRIRVRAPVTGIGGTDAGIGRAVVNLTLKPCGNTHEDPIQCTAIVFQKLTSYVPPRSQCLSTWRHLAGLELADSEPSSDDAIQLILGADAYANIL